MSTVEPVQAVLAEMNDRTKLQITKIVSESMNGKSVKIDDSVFSQKNKMSVMTNMQASYNGNPINGRVADLPQHFQLMLRGKECYILHEESGKEYPLDNVNCKAL